MAWYEDCERFFKVFKNSGAKADETLFCFKTDTAQAEHYIGFHPQFDKPYWAGYCDINGGCNFKTAEDLFNAKIYGGKSIKERWNEIELLEISGVDIQEWADVYGVSVK